MSKKVSKNCNTLILELLSIKPIAFNPLLGKIADSANAGLFMSQLLYWWGKGSKKDWVYKTIKEFRAETCLTRGEQDTAIKKWITLGILSVKKAGIPPKRHFRIDEKQLMKILNEHKDDLLKTANQFARTDATYSNSPQNNTESTPKNTSEISIYNSATQNEKSFSVAKGKLIKQMTF